MPNPLKDFMKNIEALNNWLVIKNALYAFWVIAISVADADLIALAEQAKDIHDKNKPPEEPKEGGENVQAP